jgi:hypothetical protein
MIVVLCKMQAITPTLAELLALPYCLVLSLRLQCLRRLGFLLACPIRRLIAIALVILLFVPRELPLTPCNERTLSTV